MYYCSNVLGYHASLQYAQNIITPTNTFTHLLHTNDTLILNEDIKDTLTLNEHNNTLTLFNDTHTRVGTYI